MENLTLVLLEEVMKSNTISEERKAELRKKCIREIWSYYCNKVIKAEKPENFVDFIRSDVYMTDQKNYILKICKDVSLIQEIIETIWGE